MEEIELKLERAHPASYLMGKRKGQSGEGEYLQRRTEMQSKTKGERVLNLQSHNS